MAYIYQADIFCDACGKDIKELDIPKHSKRWDSEDSDDCPQYVCDDGGEADSPQHCGRCGIFLENPLTSDGYQYVVECTVEAIRTSEFSDALKDWIAYYDVDLASVVDYVLCETKPKE